MTQGPAIGETLNHGQASVPRPSASVILLREGDPGIDVLLVRRNPAQRVMGGFWVFPGGAIDAGEGEGDDELLDHARGRDVRPVQPKAVLIGETLRIFLPGEPGYDAALG
jgi:8-oxo-dGTP pyrophosphatase MutT (NUDIX family)